MTLKDFINSKPWPKELSTYFGHPLEKVELPSKFADNNNPNATYTRFSFTIEDETCSLRATTYNPSTDLLNIQQGTPITLLNIVQGEYNDDKYIRNCKVTIGHPKPLTSQQIIDGVEIRLKAMELATQLVTCPAFFNQQISFSQIIFLATILSNYAINQTIPEIVSKRLSIFKEAIDIMKELNLEPEVWQRAVDTITNGSLEKAQEQLTILRIKKDELLYENENPETDIQKD